MPDWVEKLKAKFLKNPVNVTIAQPTAEESTIEQIAYQVPQAKKIAALCTLLNDSEGESSLVFGRTKFGVEKLGKQLNELGFTVGTLHGNKSQRAREDVLTAFRQGRIQTLLATNVAARGLDIKGIYQVINYELPESSALWRERVERTGRMGQSGKAITLLARSLGQEVKFQHLALNEDAMNRQPVTMRPEVVEIQEVKPIREPRTARERRPSSPQQERGDRRARSTRESETPLRMERPRKEYNDKPVRKTARWTEDFFVSERGYSDDARGGGRESGSQARIGRINRRRDASAMTAPEPQRQSGRGKPRGVAPLAGARRATGSKRYASK